MPTNVTLTKKKENKKGENKAKVICVPKRRHTTARSAELVPLSGRVHGYISSNIVSVRVQHNSFIGGRFKFCMKHAIVLGIPPFICEGDWDFSCFSRGSEAYFRKHIGEQSGSCYHRDNFICVDNF